MDGNKIMKEKRNGIRVPLLNESVDCYINGLWTHNKLYDITPNGAFIESEILPAHKDIIELAFILPGELGRFHIQAEVVRINWTKNKKNVQNKGFGVKFIKNTNADRILDSYVTYLRNKQIITVSKRIIEEFFGPKVPML